MRTYGADISHWEGIVEWSRGADYLPFCYYKATDGVDFIDSQFGNNQDGCDDYGVPHAPFHWWQEQQDPIEQAHHFVETTSGFDYKRRIVDVEPKVYYPGIVDKLEQHLHSIESIGGIKPAIYTSANFWNNYIVPHPSWAHEYDLIVAQYSYRLNPILPVGWTTWVMWQFTDYFWFDGCNATADGNWFNGDLTACRNWYGNYHPFVLPPFGGKTEMRVIVDNLMVRSAPSITASIIAPALKRGEVINVLDAGGNDAWIRHEKGWSCYKNASGKYQEPN